MSLYAHGLNIGLCFGICGLGLLSKYRVSKSVQSPKFVLESIPVRSTHTNLTQYGCGIYTKFI